MNGRKLSELTQTPGVKLLLELQKDAWDYGDELDGNVLHLLLLAEHVAALTEEVNRLKENQ